MFLIPALLQAQVSVFRPKIGVPAFPLTNGTFDAEIEAAPGLASNGWSALLLNDLRSWTCSVERVDYGAYVYCNSTNGYRMILRVPPDAPPEVLHLLVSHTSAGSDTNRHCVKILPAYETNFYVLHYADPQVETVNATAANGAGGSHGSVQAMTWAAPAYSLMNPRFMFNTGDEVENGVAGMYPNYLAAIDTIGAPLLITRGNNDAQGSLADWKRDIGPPTYSITMGSFYICMKDYGANESLSWFTNDYARSFTNTAITFRLFGQHFISGGSFYAPLAGQYPDLMLVGHNHTFATLLSSPFYILSSGPGWDYGAVGIFEFHKNGSGWVCSNKTVHGTSNKLQVYGDWGQPCRVTNTFQYANNGSVFTNTTWITNSLAYDFWDGRVRFLMRKADAGYTVSGGDKVAEYDYSATNTAVLVKVRIARNARTTVTVSPTVADTEPPALTILWPTNGAAYRTRSSNVLVAGTATDAGGITSVVYSMAGAGSASGQATTGRVELVAAGATWKYRDDGSDQGTAWQVTTFDDSAWASGTAELGYGDGDEATTNSFGPDPANRYITTYYRHAFETAEAGVFTNALEVSLKRDDGIVLYVDGTEAYRNNMPSGAVGYTTLATGTVSGAGESTWWLASLPAGSLTGGSHVIAVEIHQANPTSSDISFALSLGTDLGSTWLITNLTFATGTSLVSVVARDAAGHAATQTVSVIVTDDVDDDGMNDDWEQYYFGAGGAEPDGNFDGDPFSNLQEYIAGTDPTNSLSIFRLEMAAGSIQPVLQFLARTNRLYTLWFKTNLLEAGNWQVLSNDVEGVDGTLTIQDPAGDSNRFYRIHTEMR
ncbi:MAG: hypothetical protein KJ726_08320 [Verrucomicrobia bacterium]|nr:hypothetical protein [Verrucomicrobiota bacterium]MBU1910037.1 hypothetical protein [Verrucomicrobiota bacterium]